jgi:S1-C subfamily serine protease
VSVSTAALISDLDSFGLKLKAAATPAGQVSEGLEVQRALLSESRQHKALLNDSPTIKTDLQLVEARIANLWELRITATSFKAADPARFQDDLLLLDVGPDGRRSLGTQLGLLMIEPARLLQGSENRQALLGLVRTQPPTYPSSVLKLRKLLVTKLAAHTGDALRLRLSSRDPDYGVLAFGEELLVAIHDQSQDLRRILAEGHLNRAERLAGSGRSSVLALVHLERVQKLGAPASRNPAKVRETAAAAFSAAGRLPLHLRIQTNPSDDPFVQDLARFAVTRAIRERLRPHTYIQPVSVYQKVADIEISIDSVKLFVPSMSDLTSQSSSYLSHFEDVPNPAKAALKAQLEYQSISANSALSTLNYAISSYNINPTSWAVQNVNNARTQYNFQVDQYNQTVQIYNATSSTVSRPVYLPYAFREGTVRHGWHMSGTVKVGNAQEYFSVNEIDTDFVRIGTRPQDRNVNYRRDDLLDIPVGTDRLAAQLVKTAEQVEEKVARASRGLDVNVRPDLSLEERHLVSAAFYPFSDARSKIDAVPGWADEVIRTMALPEIAGTAIPSLRIVAPIRVRTGTPQEIVAYYGPAVALISGKDGAIGSGALISGDGLVLTAAHVLGSGPFEVTFPRSADAQRRPAQLVFVNDTHDVALLRVADYRAERWFEISLSERVAAGEPVIALGNPSIPGVGVALTSVSSGIVAKPYDPDRKEGLADLVADIAIASGSSGGPLISRRTGKIIGVVTAVVSPSIKEDFATSGYWAVAAPSSELGKWLGLAY